MFLLTQRISARTAYMCSLQNAFLLMRQRSFAYTEIFLLAQRIVADAIYCGYNMPSMQPSSWTSLLSLRVSVPYICVCA